MTNRRVFVYGETRHKNLSQDDFNTPIQPKLSIKPKQSITDNNGKHSIELNNSDYFNKNPDIYPKKKVDLKDDYDFDSNLYKDSTTNSENNFPKKTGTIYVLRDNDTNKDDFESPVENYSRKYVPSEKKAVNLSRAQSMEWLKPIPSEKTYFHELKFDKRIKRKPSVRCEIDEPVLHEKPLPNRAVIRNGTIVYK